jgi:hypothetical protein
MTDYIETRLCCQLRGRTCVLLDSFVLRKCIAQGIAWQQLSATILARHRYERALARILIAAHPEVHLRLENSVIGN